MNAISIHAPRMGSDPLRMAALVDGPISIHAPRMGSDLLLVLLLVVVMNFNPRSPHGERQYSQSIQQ